MRALAAVMAMAMAVLAQAGGVRADVVAGSAGGVGGADLEQPLRVHVGDLLARARTALGQGDAAQAAPPLILAWTYLASPVFGAHRGAAWSALATEYGALAGQLGAARALPSLRAQRDAAVKALAAAAAVPRAHADQFTAAGAPALACRDAAAALGAEIDHEWSVPPAGESIAKVALDCETLAAQAAAGADRATAEATARADALRGVLRGDRLTVFNDLGEPECDACDGVTAKVARAKVWIYRRGPSGALATWETLTFTFRGDKVIARHQRIAHEHP